MNTLRHIRKTVFNLTQAEFAALAGVRQSSVSRWENGVSPSLEDMQAIRNAAAARNLDWDDALFFEQPAEAGCPGGVCSDGNDRLPRAPSSPQRGEGGPEGRMRGKACSEIAPSSALRASSPRGGEEGAKPAAEWA